jgi:hypothetical protein
LLKVLAKEPAARYRTADQLGQVLSTFGREIEPEVIIQSEPEVIRPVSRPRPRRQKPSLLTKVKNGFASENAGIDWVSIGLGIMAVLSVGGLFPYWTYIFLFIQSLQR